jgi:hypothetical protein
MYISKLSHSPPNVHKHKFKLELLSYAVNQCTTTLHCTALHCTALYCTALYFTAYISIMQCGHPS